MKTVVKITLLVAALLALVSCTNPLGSGSTARVPVLFGATPSAASRNFYVSSPAGQTWNQFVLTGQLAAPLLTGWADVSVPEGGSPVYTYQLPWATVDLTETDNADGSHTFTGQFAGDYAELSINVNADYTAFTYHSRFVADLDYHGYTGMQVYANANVSGTINGTSYDATGTIGTIYRWTPELMNDIGQGPVTAGYWEAYDHTITVKARDGWYGLRGTFASSSPSSGFVTADFPVGADTDMTLQSAQSAFDLYDVCIAGVYTLPYKYVPSSESSPDELVYLDSNGWHGMLVNDTIDGAKDPVDAVWNAH